MDALLPAKVNRGITLERKSSKAEFEFGLTFMVPNLVYKFQMICLRGT
jgi:hypothetical protein